MKRVLVVAGIVVAALIVIVAVAASLIDLNKYRPKIQTELQSKLGRPVTLGTLHLRLLPLSVRIDGVTIGESAAFSSPRPFAKADEVYVSVGLFSLLSGSPNVKAVELDRPEIELIRNAQGVWNFSSIGNTGQAPQPAKGGTGGGQSLSLHKLEIDDGKVALTDQLKQQPRAVYDHIDAELTDFTPGKPFDVALSVHLPGEGKQTIALDARLGPVQGVPASAIPIDGHFKLQEVTLSGLSRFASGAIPPNTNTTASGDGSVKSKNEELTLTGNLKLQNTTVRGVKIDYPIEARYDLTDNRKTDMITIREGDVKLGDTPISITGNYDAGKTPANLDLKLNAKNAGIAEMARLAGAFGVAMNPAYQVKGTINADLSAKGPQNNPQLSGSLQAKNIEAKGGEIKGAVKVPEIDVTLSPSTILSNPFVAQSGSTKLNASFSLTQYSTPNSTIDATVKTDGADVGELVNMAKAYGVDAAKGMTGSGKLSLNAHVQGPIKDTAKLNYSGSGTLSNVSLSSPDLAKPLNIQSANLSLAQNGASIQNLSASLGSSDIHGNFSATNLAAPNVRFALTSNKIDVNELGQLQPSGESKAPSKTGNTQPSLLDKTTGGGTIEAKSIVAQEIVLSNVKATAKLDKGLISLAPLSANLFGGSESGTLTLDTRPATPTVAVNSKLSGIDSNQLLSAVSSVKNKLYGGLAASANLRFALASSAALAKTLNGQLSFNLANGHLTGMNILGELSRIGNFLGGTSQQSKSETPLKKFSGTLNIQNGVANTNDLVAELNEGSLSAKGILNLADQTINMHATAVLSSGISQTVGGSKIGGFLNTALANNKGELVLPVLVTGSLDKPTFAPDPQAIAEMKLKNLLPTTGDPGKLSTGVLGSVLGNKGGAAGAINSVLGGGDQQQKQGEANGQQQQQKQKPQDVINDVLGQFGKKKKK
jgi:AsmA protein